MSLPPGGPEPERGDAEAADAPPPPGPRADGGAGLGAWLRARREERGYGIDRVERDTRIDRRYLEALEREQYEALPAPVYARGFVRGYARYLGLDEEEALSRLPAELPRPPGLDPLPGLRGGEGPPAIPAVQRRWLLLALAVLVAGGAAFLFGLPSLPADGGDDGAAAVAEPAPAPTVAPFDEGTMPNLRNVERAEARRVLTELGVTDVFEIEVATNDIPPGRVFGQSPLPGDPLGAADVVNLIIAQAEPAEDDAGE